MNNRHSRGVVGYTTNYIMKHYPISTFEINLLLLWEGEKGRWRCCYSERQLRFKRHWREEFESYIAEQFHELVTKFINHYYIHGDRCYKASRNK